MESGLEVAASAGMTFVACLAFEVVEGMQPLLVAIHAVVVPGLVVAIPY